jgi:inner membrane protein
VDNVTHALAGMLMADATTVYVSGRSRGRVPDRFRTAAVIMGIAAAEFPDTDLVYSGPLVGMGKLGYLLHHRGHTHTIVWAVLGAMLLWWVARWWWHRRATADEAAWWAAHGSRALLALALAGTLSHLVLDWTNSYGVHPFWPLDDRWFYGDAVFIVEPWLWVVAIPPLFWNRTARSARAVLVVLLALILAASWGLGEVARPVAMLLTAGAAFWMALQRVLPRGGRLLTALLAWTSVTSTFFLGASQARAMVREAAARSPAVPRPRALDVVLNPAAGDPRCWLVMAVTTDDVMYRVSEGLVAPFPGLRSAAQCAERYRTARMGASILAALPNASPAVPLDSSRALRWRRSWAVPRSEMVALATERCEFAAALRFMRTPVWVERGNGTLLLSDARYGVSGGGFAEVMLEPYPAPCSLLRAWVPGWVPPRADVLRGD